MKNIFVIKISSMKDAIIQKHITFKEPILTEHECFSCGAGGPESEQEEEEGQSPQEHPKELSAQE